MEKWKTGWDVGIETIGKKLKAARVLVQESGYTCYEHVRHLFFIFTQN